MKIDLSGKTALVTGSTSGIGHAIVKGLAVAGANVVVNGRIQAKVDTAVAAIAWRAMALQALLRASRRKTSSSSSFHRSSDCANGTHRRNMPKP